MKLFVHIYPKTEWSVSESLVRRTAKLEQKLYLGKLQPTRQFSENQYKKLKQRDVHTKVKVLGEDPYPKRQLEHVRFCYVSNPLKF